MSCPAVAQLLSILLYNRRFFPFYTYNILAGLDKEGMFSHTLPVYTLSKTLSCLDVMLFLFFLGKGCVYSFDPVGSYERETYRAGGSAASMLQPLLDNQVQKERNSQTMTLCRTTLHVNVYARMATCRKRWPFKMNI